MERFVSSVATFSARSCKSFDSKEENQNSSSPFRDNSFLVNHDQLYIRDSSSGEKANHGKKQAVIPNPCGGAAAEPPVDKNAMVKKFMDNSGMTENYSKMCLEQNDWNFNRAAEKFMELKKGGQLPADAWQPGRAP